MRQETVLVVDDNESIRGFLCDAVLSPAGYRAQVAADGKEGLERALGERPDLILLDLLLPRLHGLDFLRETRHLNIPTIVLTAYGSEEEILKAFRLGARDFIQKPFEIDQVLSAIEDALAEERLKREKDNLTQALAHANHRLQQQMQNRATLNEIAQVITSTLNESEIFRRVIANITRILQVEAGSLLILNQATGDLEFVVTLQGDAARYSSFRLKPGQGIAGWVAESGEPLLVPDAHRDPRFYPHIDQATGFHTQSILCVPLKLKGQVIGVLEVINKQGDMQDVHFTQEDQDLLVLLASWVAVAVENARLNRSAREAAAVTALRQTVTTLAHHINNSLMSFSLELDGVEREGLIEQQAADAIVASARRSIQEVSGIIKALDQLEEIQTVPYVGPAEMIDIERILSTQGQTEETDTPEEQAEPSTRL